ncbi:MAG: hypothetical protein BWY82_02208 [Verrucomicrobia bacterium ADurb.Bin474]|nr:MAG: hypothetical protein BWY82_02208 [Verrucomicrobia bacterium ADurb.Bin474]
MGNLPRVFAFISGVRALGIIRIVRSFNDDFGLIARHLQITIGDHHVPNEHERALNFPAGELHAVSGCGEFAGCTCGGLIGG